MTPMKWGDVVFQLSEETSQLLARKKGDLEGRHVSPKLTESQKNASTNIESLIQSRLKGLAGREMSSAPLYPGSLTKYHESLKDLESRITAYQALSDTLQKMGSTLAKKLQKIAVEQCYTLQKQARILSELEEFTLGYSELVEKISSPHFEPNMLTPEEHLLSFELLGSREQIHKLQEGYLQLSGSSHAQFEYINACFSKIEKASFVEPYRQYNALREEISTALSAEDDDMYLKKLIQNVEKLASYLAASPVEEIQARLPTLEMKTIFYCIAKVQDEIQELYRLVMQHQLLDRGSDRVGLQKLADFAGNLIPLKPYFQKSINILMELPRPEAYSLQDAMRFLEGATVEPDQAKALELFWLASLGFWENGQIEKALETARIASAKIQFPSTHPLGNLLQALEGTKNIGRDFSFMGANHLKEQSLHALSSLVDGIPMCRLDFKLNGHSRRQMETALKALNAASLKKYLPSGFCADVKISERSTHTYFEYKDNGFTSKEGYIMPGASETEIEFVGVGKVIIGRDSDNKAQFSTIYVDLLQKGSSEELLVRCHTMLTMLGCPPVFPEASLESRQTRAILHVFRCFYPAECYLLEKNPKTFDLAPSDLLTMICTMQPDMSRYVQAYLNENLLPKIEKIPTLGKVMTGLDISTPMKEAGAMGLMHGMGGAISVIAPRVSSILTAGFLASQRRFQAGIVTQGLSSHKDHQEGGAEGVFMRMVTRELANNNPIEKFFASGTVQFVVDLEAINGANAYGYEDDCYGSRKNAFYQQRQNLINIAAQLQKPLSSRFGRPHEVKKYGTANEVVIRDRVAPEYIRAIIVKSEDDKRVLIEQLKKDNVLQKIRNEWYYRGKEISSFIQVATNFKEEMWYAS